MKMVGLYRPKFEPMTKAPNPTLANAAWLNWPESQRLLALLNRENGAARFIGGCVRDTLFNPEVKVVDLDIATTWRPEAVIDLLRGAGIKTLPTGLHHGTVTALLDGKSFEVTTLRIDQACDGRHAEVSFTESFEADAARRDFTINTMSCDANACLYDPYGGLADLEANRVVFIGEPEERIREDYLRILRFFRFYGRFGDVPPNKMAMDACRKLKDGLDAISGERIRSEMFRILTGSGVVRALRAMQASRVMQRLIDTEPSIERLASLLEAAPDSDAVVRLAALMPETGNVDGLSARWRLSKEETNRLRLLHSTNLNEIGEDPRAHLHGLYRWGERNYRDLLKLAAGRRPSLDLASALAQIADLKVPTFPVGGSDLVARGISPGVELGRELSVLKDWWIAQDFEPSRDACLAELDARLDRR